MTQQNILTPPEMVSTLVNSMETKAETPTLKLITQALAGGAFIALGFAFYINTITGAGSIVPQGILKLIGGATFSVGIMMVIITGAELFTSTTMSLTARLSGRISWFNWARHWLCSYGGNFIGSMMVVALCYYGGLHLRNDGGWGETIIGTAMIKTSYSWGQAFALGIGANFLVCVAVFMSLSGRTTFDKLASALGPITAFVALGFEHSVANMYLIPYAIFISDDPTLNWTAFIFSNLIPVTLGNIVGGGICMGLYQWVIHERMGKKKASQV
ncbi:formate/nitrite transporter family protein [Rothia sp. ZJ1223]|uniref:formate/nitrite transporter family protein n=1 Tax=Rothia sp. ZJ1223 TaxID=2811098 RepID=UPI00195836F4|nr:formate/nitrite transporter family protein [Rothia sp. ZJ1223]MBM7051811.1 formate/nitrite transporter family protein [Rothia sp. ZJ1223]